MNPVHMLPHQFTWYHLKIRHPSPGEKSSCLATAAQETSAWKSGAVKSEKSSCISAWEGSSQWEQGCLHRRADVSGSERETAMGGLLGKWLRIVSVGTGRNQGKADGLSGSMDSTCGSFKGRESLCVPRGRNYQTGRKRADSLTD